VAKGFADFTVCDEESARHPLYISSGQSNEVAVEPGHKHSVDAFAVEILAQLSVGEAEGVVKFAFGIGEARQVVEFVGREEFCCANLVAKMNEGE
jgi:hypothetical protein